MLVFDRQQSIELAGGNEKLADELLPMLIEELPKHRENLLQAQQQECMDTLKKHIHKLHGGTKYCGVPALRIAAAEFESIIDNRQVENIEAGLQAVISAIDELVQFYQNEYCA